MWHKVTSGDLRDSSGSWKLKWHKNPEKEPCKKESGKTEKQNRTSSQSKLIYMVIWKEEGRMIAISKWWVECLKTHAELPHQDPAPTRDVCLELCLQEETMNIARDLTCQDEAEQGSGWREECELRNREASLGIFLLKGEMLTFWVWKVVMSDYIWNFIWQLFKTVWPGDDLKKRMEVVTKLKVPSILWWWAPWQCGRGGNHPGSCPDHSPRPGRTHESKASWDLEPKSKSVSESLRLGD